jgi:transcriptional antiterminator NusG
MNWYIVQAYSGFEKKVVESIREELKKHKLEDNIGDILVPTHQVTHVKKAKEQKKRVNTSRVMFCLRSNLQNKFII